MAPMKSRTKRHLDDEIIGKDEETRLTKTLFGTDHHHSIKAKMDCDEHGFSDIEGAHKCVWHDSDDDDCTDEIVKKSKEDSVTFARNKEYKRHLRKIFKRYYGTPKWAKHSAETRQSKEGDVLKIELDKAVSKLTGSARRYLDNDPLFAKGIISTTRCPDITIGHHDSRPVNVLLFHKIRPVVLTAGDSRRIQLFRVGERLADGNFLQNVQFSDFPMTSMGFAQGGDAVICGSRRQRYMMKYHLEQGSVMQLNLPKCVSNQCPAHFTVSDDGCLLAMIAQGSQVFIFSLPAMELVKTLSAPSKVSSLQFFPDSSRELWALTGRDRVKSFCFKTPRKKRRSHYLEFQHVFCDEGAVHGTKLRLSSDGRKVACGSSTGIVNFYEVADVRGGDHPKPCTVVSNLTTSCDSISFSHDSQIMAFSSRVKKNLVKLLHSASGTVFSNYPKKHKKVTNVECIEFSPHSAYLGLGCSNGQFLLEHLDYYKEY